MQTAGGATALMYACQQCMENEVLDLIRKQPFSVKDRDRTSKTPLHYCAENPNTSCAEIILRAAPELVNAQDDNGYSTLHLAVIAGNKALIKLLITKGADVNVHDNEGHSAVHWAIVSSEKEALEMIIRAGANPSTADVHGGYPLHYAVQMCGSNCDYIGSFEDAVRVVETLLNFGVDVNVKDKDSRQPILWAASAGSAEAVIHLVSAGACVEAADKDGLTALHCAASRGHTTTLETLISLCGANVDVIDGNGCSALFYSVTLGHADATELLLQLGAEANRQDRKGRTPAHCGAAKGQLETLRILQKHGGNLWLRNVKGDIPLHEAVASGRKDLVLWLLSQNPEAINISNNDGRCPLHIASMYNNTEMVKVLLDSKSLVNPVMRTSKGVLMTPLNVALCKGHRSCGKYLQLHGGVPFSKVARLEPASVFAVRVSPSDEMMLKSAETSKEISQASHCKVSKCKSSAEVQGQESDRADTAEKKKVYRRRKKKKSTSSAPDQDSDSDDSIQDVKLKALSSRKVKKSNGVEVNAKDEHDERIKVKKAKSDTKNFKVEKNSRNVSGANSKGNSSRETVEVSSETVTGERVTKTKALQANKSFNETKNVSDLSPEDFPPLMQTINRLDAVMMEPDIEENKVESDRNCLKLQDGASGVSLTREKEVVEGNDGEVQFDTVSVDAVPDVQNEQSRKSEIEVREDEINREVVFSQAESGKAVDIGKETQKRNEKETEKAEKRNEKETEKAEKRNEKETEKMEKRSEKETEKMENKSEKETEKMEKRSEKETEKAEKRNEKETEKMEKRSEKETEKMEKRSEKETEKMEKRSEKETEKMEKRSEKETEKMENKSEKETEKAEERNEKDAKTKPVESKGTSEDDPSQKPVKSPKTFNNSNSDKKEETYSKSGKTSSASSEGGDKRKRTVTPENPEVGLANQTEGKSQGTSSVKNEGDQNGKVFDSEEKTNYEIKENEKEEPKARSETSALNDGIILQPEPQSNLQDLSQESKKPERASEAQSGGGSLKDDVSSSKESQKKTNNAHLLEVDPSVALTPGEEPKTVADNEVSHVIVPAKDLVSAHLTPSEWKGIESSDAAQTSPGTPEQPKETPENSDQHSSKMLSPEAATQNSYGTTPTNNAEPLPVKARYETNEGGLPDAVEQGYVDLQMSNEGAEKEQSRKTGDILADDDIGKEEDAEADEGNGLVEGGEFPAGGSSKKNDCENKQPKATKVSRLCRRQRDFKADMNEMSVTQLVQNTLRKYHMERGIFYQLLELKRYQIRSGRANEQVLVKRLADEYERSRVFLGMKPYSGLYKFREFEKFLYDQLKALNARRSFLIPEIKSYDDIDALSGFLKKSRYKIINDIPQPEMVCTCITQRCHHSACAYTSVPCSAYITDLRRLRRHKPRREGLFPRIEQPPSVRSDAENFAGRPATLELIQGSEKHVITLPQNYPGKGKRYYVTFTIKGAPAVREDDPAEDSKNLAKHRHAKSV